MTLKDRIIWNIIETEGGEVKHKDDSGGHTKYGITEVEARANHFRGDLKYMSKEFAFKVLERKYWQPICGDQLLKISERVCQEVADTSVNCYHVTAVKFLQRSLNVLNKKGFLYEDITVDGLMGPQTLDALHRYLSKRNEAPLVKMLNCLQGAFYVELAERREKDESFVYGWFINRVSIGGDNGK